MDEVDILESIIGSEDVEEKISLERMLSLSKQKEYEETHWYHKYRIEAIRKLLKETIEGENLKILDIGVGTGTLSKELENYGECTHIDFSNDVISFNEDLKIKKEIFPWESGMSLEKGYFDYVVFFNTLEYIENTKWALEVATSKLKDTGKIILVTLVGKNLSDEDKIYKMKHRFTYEEIKGFMSTNGLKIETSTYFMGPFKGQIMDAINSLIDESTRSINFIPKDNDERLDFYEKNELPKLGKKLIEQGEFLYVILERMTKEEREAHFKEIESQNKQYNFIDKAIINFTQQRNEQTLDEEEDDIFKK